MRHCFKLLLLTTALMAWFATSAQDATPQPVTEAAALINAEQIKPELVKQKAFDTKMVSVPQEEAISTQSEARVETKVSTKVKRPASEININGKGVNSSSSAKKSPRRADAVTVSLPSGVTAESWVITTNFFANSSSGDAVNVSYRSNVQVAFDGNDIYIAGLSYWLPNAWVKGTIDGETATFPTGQYYGIDDGDELWFVGYGEDGLCDVTFSYNATTHRLTLDNNITILEGSDAEGSYYAYHINTTITQPDEETVASGTATNQYVPVYGYYIDTNSTESQMVYPASYFEGLSEGSRISSITFYGNSNIPANLGYSTIDVYIGETSETTIANSTAMTSNRNASTLVYEGTLPTGDKTMTITFDTPYTYNGGNIVIDTYVKTASSQYSNYSGWVGQSQSLNTSFNSRYGGVKFLPKLTIEYIYPPKTQAIDFGTVEVGSSKTINAKVELVGSTTSSTNTPFSTGTPTSHAKYTSIPVTFTPTAANVYDGTLIVEAGGKTVTVLLKGVGNITGSPEALRDSAFFAGIEYNWTDSTGVTHKSTLGDIATDPDQIIAMLTEVYTNKTIPGNFKRGYSTTGGTDPYNDVYYSGVGAISRGNGYNNASYYTYYNNRGWNIEGNIKYVNSGSVYYAYMDTTQYKPYNEGVTLMLVEVRDDFEKTGPTTYTVTDEYVTYTKFDDDVYKNLRQQILRSIKSVRIVHEALRTGEGFDKGTLFKIDADKLNKFYMMAKGQLRWAHNQRETTFSMGGSNYYLSDECAPPNYSYFRYNSTTYVDRYVDMYAHPLFYHMFEQFSPVANDATSNKADIYQDLVNMSKFNVEHDCMAVVPLRNHQFQMYGDESAAADCQDVRDLMFFVPDYRMMKDDDRDPATYEKYLNYNTTHQPSMGLYVIRQDSIVPTTEADDYYMLTLTWDSNMDDFLPSNQQEYQLWQIVTDDNGNETYVPVYYMNASGEYTDAQGNLVTTPVPIVLPLEPGADKTYTQVYVPRQDASQQVTYVIRGQDKADENGKHFLSLKMSNRQSYIIPGKDPAELVFLKDATHYSRFDAQNVRNCYSNKLLINNNVAGMKADAINGKHLYITRQGFGETEPTTVATITFNASNKSYTVQMANQAAKTDFPACSSNESEEPVAGYHANRNNTVGNGQWTGTYDVPSNSNIVDLGKLIIFDNFVVDVSQNAHPTSYTYNITSDYPVEIQGSSTASAHSNTFTVPVYKTDSRVSGTFSASQVDGDNAHALPLDDISFDAKVQYSSKTEILRYDAYRWNESDTRYIVESADAHDDEQDIAPNGIAGNQDGYYTVSMNAVGTDDYTTSTVSVAMGENDKWANFVDKYPKSHAGDYIYVPVVETFTFGKKVDETSDRDDYNTYGGPLQRAASATLQLSLAGAERSGYYWKEDGKKYSYYNIKLKVEDLTMPDENGTYNVYKVRAWRKVDSSLLNENNPNITEEERAARQARKGTNGEYLFEELGYEEVNASILQNNYVFGSEVFDTNHSEDLKMTFGAQRVALQDDNDEDGTSGTITELPIEFVVRVYFTLAENLTPQGSGNGAPRRAQAEPQYYIAEQTFTTSMTGDNVVTAVNGVKANREVKSVTYVNSLGMQSSQPFSGVNVVVTRYTDGTTTTTKIVK